MKLSNNFNTTSLNLELYIAKLHTYKTMFEVVNYSNTLILLHFRINYSSNIFFWFFSSSCSFICYYYLNLFVFQLKPKYIITQYQKQACLFSPFYVKQLDHDWKTDSLSNPRVKTDSLSNPRVSEGWMGSRARQGASKTIKMDWQSSLPQHTYKTLLYLVSFKTTDLSKTTQICCKWRIWF